MAAFYKSKQNGDKKARQKIAAFHVGKIIYVESDRDDDNGEDDDDQECPLAVALGRPTLSLPPPSHTLLPSRRIPLP